MPSGQRVAVQLTAGAVARSCSLPLIAASFSPPNTRTVGHKQFPRYMRKQAAPSMVRNSSYAVWPPGAGRAVD